MTEIEEPSEVTPLKPSWLLIVFSVINMLAGTASASVLLAKLEYSWPHSVDTFSLIALVYAISAIVGQYYGTFRNSVRGASFAGSGCVVFYFPLGFAYWLQSYPGRIEETKMIWAIVIVMGCVSAGLNFWWFEKLQIHAKAHPLPTKFSIALWEVLTFVGLLGLIMLPTVYRAQANQAIYRENVAVADAPFAVPDRAEAICYQRSRTGLILASYEISETDFKSWLSEHDSELRKGGGWSNDFQMPVDVDLPDAGLRPFRSRPRDHSVTDGIIVRWSLGKVDFTITFDRIEGIAFYEEREIRK